MIIFSPMGSPEVFREGETHGRASENAPRSGKKGGVGGNFEVPPFFGSF